jgi:hypothetical protein
MASNSGYIPLPAYSSEPSSPVYPNAPLPEYHDQRSGSQGNSYRAAVQSLDADPRFARDEPQTWQRVGLLIAVVGLFWLAFHMKAGSFMGMEDA